MRRVQRLKTGSGRDGVAHLGPAGFSLRCWRCRSLSMTLSAPNITGRGEPGDALPLSVGLWPQGALLIKPHSDDIKNKFLPAVAISIEFRNWEGRRVWRACSGTLLDPRLVITAGHCVCAPRPIREHEKPPRSSVPSNASLPLTRGQALMGVTLTKVSDKNGPCASGATVTVIRYGPGASDKPEKEIREAQDTEVLLHPNFEILYGGQRDHDALVWANADLAAIVLREPVKMKFQPLALPKGEVGVGDDIAMAGYGTLATKDSEPQRQFGASKVTRIIPLETGSVIFRTEERSPRDGGPGSYAELGDSGGPAVRRSAPHTLVGIVSVGATRPADGTPMSIFMSAYSHAAWIQEMLRRVTQSAPTRAGAPSGG